MKLARIVRSFTSLVLATSLVASPAALAAPEAFATGEDAALELARDAAIAEVDAAAAEIASEKSEARARKRLERRFDRQFRRYAKRIKRLVERRSEENLRATLAEYAVRNGNLLESLLPNERAVDPVESMLAISPDGRLKTALLSLVSDARKAELRAELDREIAKAGSARAYLKQTRETLASLNGCLIGRIAVIGLAIPASSGLIFLSTVTLFGIGANSYAVAIGAWTLAGMAAVGYASGGLGLHYSIKHLKATRGSCALERRR